jgi:hypothetical protein
VFHIEGNIMTYRSIPPNSVMFQSTHLWRCIEVLHGITNVGIDDTPMSKISSDTFSLPYHAVIFSRLSNIKKFVRVTAQSML